MKVRLYELDRVEAVIAISRQVEQSLIAGGVSAKMSGNLTAASIFPIRLTHYGRPIRRMIGLPNEARLLGTVAIFSRKGYEVMLRALPGYRR